MWKIFIAFALYGSGFTTIMGQRAFITTWQSSHVGDFAHINTVGEGYNYSITWGKVGESEAEGTESGLSDTYFITFDEPGVYQVSISGEFPNLLFQDNVDLLSVEQWGDIAWQSLSNAFNGCTNLVINATDAPDLSDVRHIGSMFRNARSFNQDISHWDVSNINNMDLLFYGATSFNQPLNSWDVSNVTNMSFMFMFAAEFDQPLHSWDVSNVTDMSMMFRGASSFNQDINSWDVSNVTNMSAMFHDHTIFNKPLNNWNVGKVTDMSHMFNKATNFDQPLDDWDVGNVTDMSHMFIDAKAFNQNLNSWDVGNVTNMSFMFGLTEGFNQNLNGWEIGNVNNMSGMFTLATGISVVNYDSTLQSWAEQDVQPNISLGADGLHYCAAEMARDKLINTHGWTISGDQASNLDCVQSIAFDVLASKKIGDDPFELIASASSDLPIRFTSSNEDVATISTNTVTIVGAGETVITAHQDGNGEYHATSKEQNLTVDKLGQTILFDPIHQTYGKESFELTATASSNLPVVYKVQDENIASVNGNLLTIKGVGSTAIVAEQEGNQDYKPADLSTELVVAKASLTVKADSYEINEGEVLPAFTLSYSGFVNSEDETVIDELPTIQVLTLSDKPEQGSYEISLTGGSDDNYDLALENGVLVVTKINVLGLNDENRYVIYPNPAIDQIQILTSENVFSVEIFDSSGRLQKMTNTTLIEISDLKDGVYIVKLKDLESNLSSMMRLVKHGKR